MSSIVNPENRALQLPPNHASNHQTTHMIPIKVEDVKTKVEQQNLVQKQGKFWGVIFYFHLFSTSVLAVVLTVRGLVSPHAQRHFHPSEWYPPVIVSIGVAGMIGLVWQMITCLYPRKVIKLSFWFSPLMTCAMGVLLICTDTALGLGFGVIAIVVAVVQSLYGCWVSPRFDHATTVLSVCTGFPPPMTLALTVVAVVVSVVYCCLLVFGIGGATATGTRIDKVFVAVLLLSLAWTMQVTKNMIQVAVSSVKYKNFFNGDESNISKSLREATGYAVGPICLGSILVPIVSVIRGSARTISLTAGDSDEFLFSCADCYSGLASKLVTVANRWGFVHVGIYQKGIIQSSSDTWDMFQRAGMERLIDIDLTSSFCFLCGLAGGALSSLTAGTWSLLVHKDYATSLSLYGFLIGYFITRVAMAWPQACVLAYHVAFAENPQSDRFDATIPVRLEQLHRQHQV